MGRCERSLAGKGGNKLALDDLGAISGQKPCLFCWDETHWRLCLACSFAVGLSSLDPDCGCFACAARGVEGVSANEASLAGTLASSSAVDWSSIVCVDRDMAAKA